MDKMVVYEDDTLLVVHKPAGIATETARIGQADVVSELKNYRKKKGEPPYIGVVHRLDQPVEGLLVLQRMQGRQKHSVPDCGADNCPKNMWRLSRGLCRSRRENCRTIWLRMGVPICRGLCRKARTVQRRRRFTGNF